MKSLTKVVVALIAALLIALITYNLAFKADSSASITVDLVNLDNTVEISKEIEFVENDNLVDLVEENFENVLIENGFISNIENYETPSDFSTFISIYVDGTMSEVGLNQIIFTDGTHVSFIITEFDPNYGA